MTTWRIVPDEAAQRAVISLSRAMATAMNDDYSLPDTPQRGRHAQRVMAILEAHSLLGGECHPDDKPPAPDFDALAVEVLEAYDKQHGHGHDWPARMAAALREVFGAKP